MAATTSTSPSNETIDIPTVAADVLAEARAAKAGRAARTLTPGAGARLKQTVLALTAGAVLADHENPGEATIQVLSGIVELTAGDTTIRLEGGGYSLIPRTRHGVASIDDAVLLITVASS